MPVIIDGTLGVNAAAITTTNWTPTNIATGGNTTLGDAAADTVTINASTVSTPNGLNFDSNTLVIDATNDKVGVGIASSLGAKLDVRNSAASTALRVYTNDTTTAKIVEFKGYDNALGEVTRFAVQANGWTGVNTASPNRLFSVVGYDSTTNSANVSSLMRITHNTSGTPTAGIATGIQFAAQSLSGTDREVADILAVMTDVTAGADKGALTFRTAVNNSLSEKMRITSDGHLALGTSGAVSPQFSNRTAIEIGNAVGTLTGRNTLMIGSNFYTDSTTAVDKFVVSKYAQKLVFDSDDGMLKFYSTASAGTANANATMVERLRIAYNGAISIATTDTNRQFVVNGGIALSAGNGNSYSYIDVADGSASITDSRFLFRNGTDTHAALRVVLNSANNVAMDAVQANNTNTVKDILWQVNGGNFGIGTSAATTKLHVAGSATFAAQSQTISNITGGHVMLCAPSMAGWGVGAGIAGRSGDAIWAMGSNGSTGTANATVFLGVGSVANSSFTSAIQYTQNGVVQLYAQPGFYAYGFGSAPSGTSYFTYSTVHSNRGNYYNNANGRFTAPVSGYYMFTAGDYGTKYRALAIGINGTGQINETYVDATTTGSSAKVVALIYLNAGDYVGAFYSNPPSPLPSGGGTYFHFGGYLIG